MPSILKFLGSSFLALCAVSVLLRQFHVGSSESAPPEPPKPESPQLPQRQETRRSEPKDADAPIPYEQVTDSLIVADFQIVRGETYNDAGRRLVEYGKELCLTSADLATLRLVDHESGKLYGTLDLPLTSFLDFHSGDPTSEMMASKMWQTNAILLLQDALGAGAQAAATAGG